MGLFGRKKNKVTNNIAPESSPTLSEADLADAAKLMDRWDASMGNSDAVWDCLEVIARRGGFRGDQATLMEVVDGKDAGDVTQRPWRWWNAATRLAHTSGDHVLAGRIFLFSHLFVNQMAPKMSAGDMMQTGLEPPKNGLYQSLAAAAVESLAHLPANLIVHDTATGKVDVATALRLAEQVAGTSRP